ncbi:hypothetical protein FHX82_004618 [Amycolatopsis bartoniae]|uniref:hypothetical protein n=1 Tax=Amycolatopsis bartoniae TaxID=941986 RepID=UPI0016061C41|nr:hypothetical protein [Amycolatopsis bartoniae]MBB2937545.1 hypothetical protein [Amycolatopsis bartoniae]
MTAGRAAVGRASARTVVGEVASGRAVVARGVLAARSRVPAAGGVALAWCAAGAEVAS